MVLEGVSEQELVDTDEAHQMRNEVGDPLSIVVKSNSKLVRDPETEVLKETRSVVSVNLVLTRDLPPGTLIKLPSDMGTKYIEVTGTSTLHDYRKSWPDSIFAKVLTRDDFGDKEKDRDREKLFSWDDLPLIPFERAKLTAS